MSLNVIARKLANIQSKGAMRAFDIVNLLDARPETLSRWNKGKTFPRDHTLNVLIELDYLVNQLAYYYEPDDIRNWLYSPQRLRNGQMPAELIKQGQIKKLMQLIHLLRLAAGEARL